MRRRRRLAIAVLILSVPMLWLLWGPLPAPTRSFDKQSNAIWLGHKWFDGRGDVVALVSRLKATGIRELYVHVGPLDAKGQIPAPPSEPWHQTNRALHAEGFRVHAWLGGLTTYLLGQAPDTVDLANPDTRRSVAATAAALVKGGAFDGVHYDLELIPEGDAGWLALLEQTRKAIGDATLGADVPNLRFVPLPNLWTEGYLRQVAERVDEVAVMAYDTAMPTPNAYARILRWETPRLVRAVQSTGARLFVGVPTYDEWSKSHFPAAETVQAALLGLRLGLEDTPDPSPFQGYAVYAEWTTDDQEWRALGDRAVGGWR